MTISRRERARAAVGARSEVRATEVDDWEPVDLRPALEGQLEPLLPSVLRRPDGLGLFYVGQLNGIHGDSGIGKSWLVLLAAVECIRSGEDVIWIDFEDPNERAVLLRLRALGLTNTEIVERFHYVSPDTAADETPVEMVALHAEEVGARLVVLDSVGEAFGLEGINEASDEEVGEWTRRVGRRLADTGAAVVLVDHITKANDQPLHPSGSKRKRAAITGASYYVVAKEAISKEAGGLLIVTCAKDRHGNHQSGKPVASIRFSVPAMGRIEACVNVPESPAERDSSRLLTVAREVVAILREAGEPLSQRELLSKVKGNKDHVKASISYAVQAGAVRIEDGRGRTTLHVYVSELPDVGARPAPAGIDWTRLLDIAAGFKEPAGASAGDQVSAAEC